jgi:glycosyltransferase involved in cell wall biosynthesis
MVAAERSSRASRCGSRRAAEARRLPAVRIAVVGLTWPHRGGIAHYGTLLVRALRRRHEVCFVTLRRQYPKLLFPGRTQHDRSTVNLVEQDHPWLDSINPLTWLATAWRLRRGAHDLVLIHWWHPFFGPCFGTVANLLLLSARTPVAFLCHNVMPHERSRLDRLLTRFAFWRARHFIVHSEADRALLRALKPAALIRRGDHPRYDFFAEQGVLDRQGARRRLALEQDARVLLFFGYVRPYKGLRHLLDALPAIVRECPCTLLIVGEFYEPQEPYRDLIAAHGLQERVRIVDRYVDNEEVGLYFGAADVAVLPYESASQSGVAQIAFGLGVPVITTDVGGLGQAVEHGVTGLLVPPRAPDRLAEAVIGYFRDGWDPRLRAELERRAGGSGWQSMVEVIEALLQVPAGRPAGKAAA